MYKKLQSMYNIWIKNGKNNTVIVLEQIQKQEWKKVGKKGA